MSHMFPASKQVLEFDLSLANPFTPSSYNTSPARLVLLGDTMAVFNIATHAL